MSKKQKEKKPKKEKLDKNGEPKKKKIFIYPGAIARKDILFFTKNLAILLKTGSTLPEALEVLGSQAKGTWQQVIQSIHGYVEQGLPFGSAVDKYPKVFSTLYRGVVAIGEQSGTLEENLNYINVQMEKDYELRRQVLGAMMYPIIVFLGTLVIGTGVAIFVLPKLSELFGNFDVELPFTTRFLLYIADFFDLYGLWATPLIVGGSLAFFFLLRAKFARPVTHWLILRLPVVKDVSQHVNLAIYCRTLSILLRSGVTIDDALVTCAKTATNQQYSKFIKNSQEHITSGSTMAGIMSESPKLFPVTDVQIIQVGERSGTLSESLEYCAELHEKEVAALTRNLATLLEPIILLVLGLAVAGLALSVITPIYSITDQFRA